MHFYKRILISLFIFMGSFIATASESTCHYPTQSGICYHSDYEETTCGIGDKINISGVIEDIHSENILPNGLSDTSYYQYYFTNLADTSSRFTHWTNARNLFNSGLDFSIENRDSIYAKVIQLKEMNRWEMENAQHDSADSDMMAAVDPNFILVTWALPIQIGDSIVIEGYTVGFDLMCSNMNGNGIFDGEYTIYPASTTPTLPKNPNSQNHQTPIRYYTVDGKLQTQKPEFLPVVGVKNRQ